MSQSPQLQLVPFERAAIKAIARLDLATASQLANVTFGPSWSQNTSWAHDYLEHLRRWRPQARLYLVVQGGEAIGRVGLSRHGQVASYEISYVLMPLWRGQGLGTQATRQLIDLARTSYDAARVTAVIKSANTSSRRVLEKLGFAPSHQADDHEFFELVLVS